MEDRQYHVERLSRQHDRAAFSCGEDVLDTYLRQRARQDDVRHVATVFELVDAQEQRVAGYYTLSAPAVHLTSLPAYMQQKLRRYSLVPVVLLGRLAIDLGYRTLGLGEALLFNALRRAFDVGTRQIAAMAVTVDALHDNARAFYERYGFQRFPDNADQLFLPMLTIARLLDEVET